MVESLLVQLFLLSLFVCLFACLIFFSSSEHVKIKIFSGAVPRNTPGGLLAALGLLTGPGVAGPPNKYLFHKIIFIQILYFLTDQNKTHTFL